MSTNAGLVHELPAWCRGTGHELVASGPDGERHRLPDPSRQPRGAVMFKDLPDWGIRAPIRTDGEGFDTKDWLLGKAAAIPDRGGPLDRVLAAWRGGRRGARLRFPFTVNERDRVWAHNVASLYEQATESQWDASRDIEWADLPGVARPRGACRVSDHDASRRERVCGALRAGEIHPADTPPNSPRS